MTLVQSEGLSLSGGGKWLGRLAIIFSILSCVLGLWLMSGRWESLAYIQRVLLGTVFSFTPLSVILAIIQWNRKN